jgi:hypothetical protein
MPATVWMQATAVTQATTVTSATSNIKNDSNIMIAKTVKPATAWRAANSSRDNRNITVSTADGRPSKARMPEIQK